MVKARVLTSALLLLILIACETAAPRARMDPASLAAQDKSASEERTVGERNRDNEISAAVKTQLLAEREVSGLDIEVDTYKGVVTLRGLIDSEREGERAVEVARSVSGVSDVHSRLAVE
ncbi:MAG: BON domain-containing protein [Deltaproteobacteria bacterium]|nr:BON domain-containing protein [Deltaproteobacteria bacterium]